MTMTMAHETTAGKPTRDGTIGVDQVTPAERQVGRLDGRPFDPFPEQTAGRAAVVAAQVYAETHHKHGIEDTDQSREEFIAGLVHAALAGYRARLDGRDA